MIPLLTVIALFAAALWWTQRRLVRVDVTGPSMLPTLNPGDVVLARRTTGRRLRPGRIVVAEAPPDASQPSTRIAGRLGETLRCCRSCHPGRSTCCARREVAAWHPSPDLPDASATSRWAGRSGRGHGEPGDQ